MNCLKITFLFIVRKVQIVMTDKELFFKYNFQETTNFTKNEIINKKIFFNKNNYFEKISLSTKKWLVLLHGTYACNSNCIYCENHVLREQYNNIIISEDIIKQIVQKLGPNIREITWHGGESLLLPEHLFILLYEEIKKNNYQIRISLQTNGILLTPEKQKFLEELGINWGTSFDGLQNDKNRGVQSTQAILNLLKREPQLGGISVTTNESIYNLIQNYEYLKSLGFKNTQSCIVRENVGEGTNICLVNDEIASEEVIKYIDYWIHDTNNPLHDRYVERQIKRLLGKTNLCEDTNCIGGWLVIDPLGNISTCGMIPKYENFGNIKDILTYHDILLSSKYLKNISDQKSLILKECQNCEYLTVCYGGCMGLNYEQNKDYKQLNLRNCLFVKKILDGIYELIKNIDITLTNKYNPYFLEILNQNNYFSLNEIKNIEEENNK